MECKFFIVLFAICILNVDSLKPKKMTWKKNIGYLEGPERGRSVDAFPEQWFSQYLDHFDPTNTAKWDQLYFSNDAYYKPGGPVFLFIGGEGPANNAWMSAGVWTENARHFNALAFLLEHRYYGKSHPTPDASLENLKYLNSEQALADLAYFIEEKTKEHNLPEGTKWIAFGGSYPGNLAAWLRLKYPHLVYASIASSAPVLAKVDFYEYFDVVRNSLASHNAECPGIIKEATMKMEKILTEENGIASLEKTFKLCPGSLNTTDNIEEFFQMSAYIFAGTVQYNNDNNPQNINTLCDIMVNEALGEPINRYAALLDMTYIPSGDECLQVDYEGSINSLKLEKWEEQDAGREWYYQTCTEFGYYQTNEKPESIFGSRVGVDYFIKLCEQGFDTKFNAQFLDSVVANTNSIYGGLGIEVSRVLMLHGSIDPWHALGVLSSSSDEMPVIYIEGASHCADMQTTSVYDSPQLADAKKQVTAYLTKWLQE